jgi:molybdenum cofactor guanylyltransferase
MRPTEDIRVPGPAPQGGSWAGGARTAGIVLAGGRSTRMGRPKAALEWHGSTLLHRVAGIVARAVDGPVAVVRAPGQELPSLPPGARVVEDAREGRGPLQGLAAGLAAVAEDADLAYVSSTDVPLLHPAFVAAVLAAAEREDVDVALPVAQGYKHPLAAAYRTSLLGDVEELIASDRMRPAFLFERCRVRELDEGDLLRDARLSRADPELLSLRNVNDPAEYEETRARPAPPVTVRRFGTLAPSRDREPLRLRAATLGAAAAAAGVPLDRHVVAALNGDQISRDPELPLAAGDLVAFLAADAGG